MVFNFTTEVDLTVNDVNKFFVEVSVSTFEREQKLFGKRLFLINHYEFLLKKTKFQNLKRLSNL